MYDNARPCEECKWYEGYLNGMAGNIGSDYPCDSCRVDRFESKEN